MTDDRHEQQQLTEALLAEDRVARAVAPDPTSARDAAWLTALLDREQAMERRVRGVAVRAWAAVVALVPLLGVAFFLVRIVPDDWSRDAVRAAVLVLGVFAILATFLAVLTTVAWLFRSRSGSLAVIERRLAALEDLLARRR
jgi:hypothetical protein